MTTTRELLREGEYTRDGRMLTPNSVTWRDQIPLMARADKLNGLGGDHLVGAVTNIRREGNRILGDLSVDIEDNLIVTCEVDNTTSIKHVEGVEFTSARLVGAYVNRADQWPWTS